MKSDKNVRAPNILRVTKRFNEVSLIILLQCIYGTLSDQGDLTDVTSELRLRHERRFVILLTISKPGKRAGLIIFLLPIPY